MLHRELNTAGQIIEFLACGDDAAEADRRWNCHDKLLAACEGLRSLLNTINIADYEIFDNLFGNELKVLDEMKEAEAAIAEAKKT